MRTYDLNIFYREEWDDVKRDAFYTDNLTIEVYIYESDELGVRKYETGIIFDCDEFETSEISSEYPFEEYGFDWWDFIDNFKVPTRRIAKIFKSLPKLDEMGNLDPNIIVSVGPSTT